MIVVEKVSELREVLGMLLHSGDSIGFVPTMGALHRGHTSLIKQAKSENQIVISSIFVNPTQFNDKNDLLNYPRTPESDAIMLSDAGCDVLFIPSVEEIYPDDKMLEMDFGSLERVMEGSFRPGHFKGVATVVSRFFEIINPDKAYFGEKDFQQLAIINEMNRRLKTGIVIVGCETLREPDGLALSSRNIHLTEEERASAGIINSTLRWAAEKVRNANIEEVKKEAAARINAVPGFKVQYFEFVDSTTLQSINKYDSQHSQRICTAVLTSKTRLIDNVPL